MVVAQNISLHFSVIWDILSRFSKKYENLVISMIRLTWKKFCVFGNLTDPTKMGPHPKYFFIIFFLFPIKSNLIYRGKNIF